MQKYGKVITIEIPMLPPSINHAYISRVYKPKHGGKQRVGRFMSKTGKEFKKMVQEIIKTHPDKDLFPVAYNVRLEFEIHFPSRRRSDCSNRCKVAEDSLVPFVIKDDCFPLVSELFISGKYKKDEPKIIIKIIEIKQDVVQTQLDTNPNNKRNKRI